MILIDTSVWIDLFNNSQSPYAKHLKELIEKDADLCLIDIILAEVLQGIKDDRIFEVTKDCLLGYPILKPASLNTYISAANIYRSCRKKGITVQKTVDLIISAVAIENNLSIFHNDKDFDRIAECTNLRIYNLMMKKE